MGKRRGDEHKKLVSEVWHSEYNATGKANFHNGAKHLRHFDVDEVDAPGWQNQDIEYWPEEYEGDN